MPRIPYPDLDSLEPSIRKVLEAQRGRWGGPLLNHLLYARRPSIFALMAAGRLA